MYEWIRVSERKVLGHNAEDASRDQLFSTLSELGGRSESEVYSRM